MPKVKAILLGYISRAGHLHLCLIFNICVRDGLASELCNCKWLSFTVCHLAAGKKLCLKFRLFYGFNSLNTILPVLRLGLLELK